MRLMLLLILFSLLQACSKPIDILKETPKVAIVRINYDSNIYLFTPTTQVSDRLYTPFSGKYEQTIMHETLLNEFIVDLMKKTKTRSDISIVRPLKLLNTTLMQDANGEIRYEFMLDPYDPIDITDTVFMAGLAKKLAVDAVVQIDISYAVYLDEKTLWEEYKDPYAQTLAVYRMQLSEGHETSQLRTTIRMTVVDRYANTIYDETRFLDTDSDQILIDDRDLNFDGGVSPKLLQRGLNDWLNDWVDYLPKYEL